jgi:hypothetical protein
VWREDAEHVAEGEGVTEAVGEKVIAAPADSREGKRGR